MCGSFNTVAVHKIMLARSFQDFPLFCFESDHAHNPALRTRWINDQMQPTAIAMTPSAKSLNWLFG
ncbi:hypothetical protein ASD8599_01483 [Ascidiaceihabitans donghaensis]|uniref:Uncharacterized protein n=1 Tax=Ascidiaceihabitans donghaensis TaxID=1510460 RepID=A0A2R8BCD8_9RHOB|nr:hypothetical protein ASD8599_01483 [Ascidiaceihabitans donghaensis]